MAVSKMVSCLLTPLVAPSSAPSIVLGLGLASRWHFFNEDNEFA